MLKRRQNFVVVDQGRLNGVASGNKWTGDFAYQTAAVPAAKQYGIAIWISEPGRVKPIQAVGDWLSLHPNPFCLPDVFNAALPRLVALPRVRAPSAFLSS
ncbi:hypothetical protein N9Y23_01480 [Pseudomonadales bacterium]|nr:hypothetical protein [Pseudomonadales bacterium]